jgi:hypothetical protein
MLTIIKPFQKTFAFSHTVFVLNPFFSISSPGFQKSSPGFFKHESGFFSSWGPGFSRVRIFLESEFRSMPCVRDKGRLLYCFILTFCHTYSCRFWPLIMFWPSYVGPDVACFILEKLEDIWLMNVFPMFNSICLYLSKADTLLILTLFPNCFIYFVAFAVFSAV